MKEQALQKIKQPPKKLAALLELINGLPSDKTHRLAITPKALRKKAEAEGETDKLAHVISRAIADLPGKLKDYVLLSFWDGGKSAKGEFDLLKEGNVVERYEQLWDAYLVLREIARRPNKDEKPALWVLHPQFVAPVFLEIDGGGMLRDVKTIFFQAIGSGVVEARRIRECPICKRIFWAGRITMKCCSTRCSNTFRVHNYRYKTEEEKAEYKLRRMKLEEKRQTEARKKARVSPKKGKK